MQPQTTYTVKSKREHYIWQFKYDLNGNLIAFEIVSGILTTNQMRWLFTNTHFPAIESIMVNKWIPLLKKDFEIDIGEPDISFDAFWKIYKYPVQKKRSQAIWEKLSKADRIKAIKAIKSYDGMLSRKKIDKAMPDTYLRNRRYEDDFNAVH